LQPILDDGENRCLGAGMKALLLGLLVCSLSSCISIDHGKDFSRISLGMSKAEVLSLKGKPYETAARGEMEYFIYATHDLHLYGKDVMDKYYIRFVKGEVESYGRVGDFDSTKDPTLRLINKELNPPPAQTR